VHGATLSRPQKLSLKKVADQNVWRCDAMSKVIAWVFVASFAWTSVATADNFSAEGVVNAVKSKEHKLNITHGPVLGLMSGMTMDFVVQDPHMLDEIQAGQRIRFVLTQDSRGNLEVTELEQISVASSRK
jgi:Cu/Ag efflux protein CusF